MTYRAIAFTSLAEFNQTVEANSTWRPIGMAAGHVANSWCVMFDIPAQKEEEAVAEKGSHKPEKYPASEEEEEDDQMVEEEEVKEKPEEEEKPETPRRAVPRRPEKAPPHVVRRAAPVIRHQKKKGK